MCRYVFNCQLVETALFNNFEKGLGCFQRDIVGGIVDIVERRCDARPGLLNLISGVVAVEQILGDR